MRGAEGGRSEQQDPAVVTRPMTPRDVAAAISIFTESVRPMATKPGPERVLLERLNDSAKGEFGARFQAILERFCETDPAGAWFAEVTGDPAGFAVARRRDKQWTLPMLFVSPSHQSRGIGRALLARALEGARSAPQAMIISSTDPRAIRAYARAGFRLNPAVKATGTVVSDAIPLQLGVRSGSVGDLRLIDRVDYHVRGSSRLSDIEFLLDQGAKLLIADGVESGYAVHFGGTPIMDGQQLMLVAETPSCARRLLWAALSEVGPEVELYALTAQQSWAVETAIDAGLAIAPDGPVFTRGLEVPPTGWIPSGIFF